MQHINLGMHCG